MPRKIMLVFGTRPEAIKVAPLILQLQQHKEDFETIVCTTGQHRDMLRSVMDVFGLTADYDLDIMQQGQDLYDVTCRVLMRMREVLKEAQPDIVLVHGDTTTSTAAALAAFYQHIPVGHIEAGLRTHDIYSPWPEELNRQLTGRIAHLHFAPTAKSKEYLLAENIDETQIFVTGNTVIDALQWVRRYLGDNPTFKQNLHRELCSLGYDTQRLIDTGRRMVLITGHRRENFGDGFIQICSAIRDLRARYPEVDFIYQR